MPATWLERIPWTQAERALHGDAVVAIPRGAAAKQHGHHMPLGTDAILARHLAQAVAAHALATPGLDLAISPLVAFHHDPAFTAYPGSVSLEATTARDLLVDIARSYARHGPRRIYVLNTGLSTVGPLREAAGLLEPEGVVLHWLDWAGALAPAERAHARQPRGSHADETETSILLHLDPAAVDMARATTELAAWAPGGFQWDAGTPGTHSPSGVWGDATLATADKGATLWGAVVHQACADLAVLAMSPTPTKRL